MFIQGITNERLYGVNSEYENLCLESLAEVASGAEIMGNKEMLFFTKSGKVIKLHYNTLAPGFPKKIEDEFPGFRGKRRKRLTRHFRS